VQTERGDIRSHPLVHVAIWGPHECWFDSGGRAYRGLRRLDLVGNTSVAQRLEICVREGVIPDLIPHPVFETDEVRVTLNLGSDHEEGGMDVVTFEY
jgi:hypothetical protein